MKTVDADTYKISHSRPTQRPDPSYFQNEDEISLYEIVSTLAKRKIIIIVTAAIFLVVGLAFALIKEDKYLYTVAIELGSIDGETTTMIGTPETVKEKLEVAYIPQAIAEYRLKKPSDRNKYEIDVEFGKGSKLITLKSKGKESLATVYQQLQQDVVDRLIRDHQQKLSVPINNLNMKYEQAKIVLDQLKKEQKVGVEQKKLEKILLDHQFSLAEYQNSSLFKVKEYEFLNEQSRRENALQQQISQSQLYLSQVARLKKDRNLLKQEIVSLSAHIKSAVDREQQAVSHVSGEQNAMLLMLLGKEVHDYRSRLVDLEERLNVTLENNIETTRLKYEASVREETVKKKEVEEVKAQLVKMYIVRDDKIKQLSHQVDLSNAQLQQLQLDLKSETNNQKEVYHQLGLHLKGVQDTQALTLPMKSDQSVGLSKILIIAIALIVGSLFGVFIALIVEAFYQSRRAAINLENRMPAVDPVANTDHEAESENTTQLPDSLAIVLADAELLTRPANSYDATSR